jgi:transcriptional regulator with XRE-family HTH domain
MGMEAVAPWLRQLRADEGLTQAEAAARIGVNKKTVERWEAGKHEPPASELAVYVKALGGEVKELLRLLVGLDDQPAKSYRIKEHHLQRLEQMSDDELDALIAFAERTRRPRTSDQ